MGEIGFGTHALDRCLFLPFRPAEEREVLPTWFDHDSQNRYVLDGLTGLHVDDYVGGGEGLSKPEDLKAELVLGPSCGGFSS